MTKNIVKEKLRTGKPTVGTFMNFASPLVAEYLAHVGFDWLVVDTEHSPADMLTTTAMFQAISTTSTVPMARVAGNDHIIFKKHLDAGAMGLIVPMVNSATEAEHVVRGMKFPPEGVRSAGGGRANLYGSDYPVRANDEIAIIVMIEHIDAVNNAREILSVPGIDGSFIGPNDLSKSMGCAIGAPEHEEAIQEVLRIAKEIGTPAGLHCGNAEQVNMRIEQGFQFLAMGSDVSYLVGAANQERGALKQ